jgi:hypothetical protein
MGGFLRSAYGKDPKIDKQLSGCSTLFQLA